MEKKKFVGQGRLATYEDVANTLKRYSSNFIYQARKSYQTKIEDAEDFLQKTYLLLSKEVEKGKLYFRGLVSFSKITFHRLCREPIPKYLQNKIRIHDGIESGARTPLDEVISNETVETIVKGLEKLSQAGRELIQRKMDETEDRTEASVGRVVAHKAQNLLYFTRQRLERILAKNGIYVPLARSAYT
jgi:hypothetical protein